MSDSLVPSAGADEREIHTARIVRASPDRVWAAFADPQMLASWWGPQGFRNTFETFDLEPGGHWRFVMQGPDGRHYRNEAVFTTVLAPHLVMFRHLSAPVHTMSLRFDDAGAGCTRVDWQMRFEDLGFCTRNRRLIEGGSEQNLDRLEARLAGLMTEGLS